MADDAERPEPGAGEPPGDEGHGGDVEERTRDPEAPGVGAVGPDDDPGEVPEPNEPA